MLWTARLAEHEAAIRALVSPQSLLAFRQVRYTEAELRALQDRVTADVAWLATIPVALLTSSMRHA